MKIPVPVFQYSIKNEANDAADIFIDGDIVDASTQQFYKEFFGDDTTTSFKSFRDQLNAVEAKTFNVYINSGGGLVTDAMAIHDLLKDIQSKGKTVNTIGRGIIASAATYILMAGASPRMSKNSWFMIHNVSGFVYGDVNLVESYAETLRKFNNRSRDFYAEFTQMRKEDITKMMNAETWMTADEAKQKGFIKEIDGEEQFTQAISRDKWQYSNMAVLNAYNAAVKQPPPAPQEKGIENIINQNHLEMKKFFQDLGASIAGLIKNIKAPENNDHQALMNEIANAVSKPFNEAAEQMEAQVTEIAKSANQPVDFTQGPAKDILQAAVDAAVNAAKAELASQIAGLEKTNGEQKTKILELENDFLKMKGARQGAGGNGEKPPTVQGTFSNE